VTISVAGAASYSTSTGAATASAISESVRAVDQMWRKGKVGGTLIQAGDKQIILSSIQTNGSATTEPKPGWTCTMASGEAWPIEAVEPVSPSGAAVIYILLLRKG
jgi:hypothetical protein